VIEDSLPIRFIIPCSENWASWDAAVILYSEKEDKRVVHIVFLQLTLNQDHEIYAKGLNQVRDAIPEKWKSGEGEGVDVHYHYVLVLLTQDETVLQIPKWRSVLLNSKGRKKDPSWGPEKLRQSVMFVPLSELRSKA
jgi:hypothetical protein